MYKTVNFKKPITWLRKIIFIGLFLILPFAILIQTTNYSVSWFIIITLYIFFIVVGQIDELEINNISVTIEQKSILPFLRSKKIIPFSEIKSLRMISDQSTNDRGWLLYSQHKKNILELNLHNKTSEKISGSLHPKGIVSIKTIIEKNMQTIQ